MSGSSIGTILGGIVGGIAGYFLGNPYLGASIGMAIGGGVGSALDPPKTPKNTGPRLSDLTVQTATYGASIPVIWGTVALFGNIFWLENNKLKEVKKTESSGGKGLSGGSSDYVTYSYYATFALGLCDGPITGIKKIWIGPKLFYDSTTEDPESLLASRENQRYFRLYLGTDTQEPDPRMQSTIGVDNTPAYRGLAYIMFYDLPLADYGNTLIGAQIKVEVVRTGTETALISPVSETASQQLVHTMIFKDDIAWLAGTEAGAIQQLRSYNIGNEADPYLLSTTNTTANVFLKYKGIFIVYPYVYLLVWDGPIGYVMIYNIANPSNPVLLAPYYTYVTYAHNGKSVITEDNNYIFVSTDSYYSSDTLFVVVDITNRESPLWSASIQITGLAGPRATYIYNGYLFFTTQTYTVLYVFDITNPLNPVYVTEYDIGGASETYDMVIVNGYCYIRTYSIIYVVDISDLDNISTINTVTGVIVPAFGQGQMITDGRYLYLLGGAAYQDISIYKIEGTYSVPLFVLTEALMPAGSPYVNTIAIKDNYIYCACTDQLLRIYFFFEPVISSDLVPLSTIVGELSLKTNLLTAADIDVTSLTPLVRGYRTVDVDSIRGGIEPLQSSWPFDVVQRGYKLTFILRGGASVDSITSDDLDARSAADNPGVQINNSREMDYFLPKKVVIKFFDVNREYDTGEQYHERINTDAINVRALDFPIVLSAEEAAQKCEMLLYLYWMERYDISFSLPPSYIHLEPADIVTLTTDDGVYDLRIVSINYSPEGRMEVKAKYNSAAAYLEDSINYYGSFYNPTSTGENSQSTGVSITSKGASFYQLLDIPMLTDIMNQPGYLAAMAGYKTGWPGGSIYESVDEGFNWNLLTSFSTLGSTIGYCENSLSSHGGTSFDKSSTLSVKLFQGAALSSVTEAQLFSGQNWFAYGYDQRWEIIAAQNCDLQIDGTYILSDFLRGQLGTEWTTGQHIANDVLILLNADYVNFVVSASASIDIEKLYRGVTRGDLIDNARNFAFTYRAVNLTPLSPVHLTGNRHPSTNDWTLTWTRRSRFSAWKGGTDAPIGEASESYVVEVYSSGSYDTLKRTITASSATVQYTSADQVTDFGSNQSTLYLKIYQISDVVGYGYPLTTSITRS